MKLKEYIDNLNQLVKENPAALEYDVVTAKDAEGNGYEEVYYEPSIGHYDEDEREFYPADSEDFEEEFEYTKEDINAICVN